MKVSRRIQKYVLLGLISTHISAKAAEDLIVKVDGSSTVFPISEAVAEDFQNHTKGKIKVTVGISGTGGGFKKFCRGETDVQDASRPIMTEEMGACRQAKVDYFELPIAYDALTIVVNKQNSWADSITLNELKILWSPEAQGKIKTWAQVRPGWPDQPIHLFGADTASGTFDYFSEAVNGKAKSQRSDYSPNSDDNALVQGVSSDKFALGYIPFAYASSNAKKLKILAVNGGEKSPRKIPVMPSEKTVLDGTYYPFSRPLFIYVNSVSAAKPHVKQFVEHYLKTASRFAKEVRAVQLPNNIYTMTGQRFQKLKLGTVFGGNPEVGLKVNELVTRETKL